METVAQDFHAPIDPIQQLHQLVKLLTNSTNFRKNLPDALRLLNQCLGASNALLFEVGPICLEASHFSFQRILQIPLIGDAKEHTIPGELAKLHFPINELGGWLNKIKNLSLSTSSVNTSEVAGGGQEIHGTLETIDLVSEHGRLSAIIKSIALPESSFLLFPLMQGENIVGLLFFLSANKENWEPVATDLARSGAALITNLLEQQYTTNQLLLKQQLLPDKNNAKAGENIVDPLFIEPVNQLANEQVFSSIISSITPDFVFIIDLGLGEAIYCNVDAFLGYNFKETVNPLHTFINNIHPDFKAGALKRFFEKMERIDNDETLVHELMVRHKDGHWVWISERIKVYKRFADGKVKQYLSFMQDITDKKTASLALEKSEERYRNFITYSSEGIYYTNCGEPISIHLPIEEQTKLFYKNAYVEECNLVMAKMYDFESVDEMTGQTIEKLHQGEDYEKNKDSFREIAKNNYQVEDTETLETTTSGEKRYFINRAVGIIEQDHLIGMWGVQRDITEKRQAEILFEKNMLRFSNILKDAQMGLWEWELDQQTLQVNETYLKLIGREGYDLVFDQNKMFELIHPDDRFKLLDAVSYHIMRQTDNYQMAVRLKYQTGEWRWLQIYGRLVEQSPDGKPKRISGMLLDIHQVKTTEILLQEGEALLKAALEAMPDTKLHINLDGTIIAVYNSPQNKVEQKRFSQHIVGGKLAEVMPVFNAKGLLFNAGEAVKTKCLQTFEYMDVEGDETYYFEARINAINEQEALISLRDITSVKKTENDLNEQIYKHDQNVRQLKKYIESNLQLENFAYIASHDLREPLRTMRMFGQFLKKRIGDQLDKENLSHLDFIISSAKRMNELIEGILTYSRVDTDPLDKEVIPTADLLADSIDSLSNTIEKQQATVVIEDIPAFIYGSRIRLEQVFQNLIANGIKFGKPNTRPQIIISSKETKTHWIFTVTDNGIGIKEEFFDQIFVLFKKLHNNQDFEGVGIGLALLKRIVEQHQGEIWLESKENIGTSFSFSLEKENTSRYAKA